MVLSAWALWFSILEVQWGGVLLGGVLVGLLGEVVCGLDEVVESGLDPESGMRVVSSVTPWGSAAAICATEAAYRAVDELEG